MRHARFALLASLGALLTACSAIVGDYEILECEPGVACEDLNAALPASQCIRYYCRDDGQGCEARPRDEDGDGFWDPDVCDELVDGKADCNDTDPRRYPGAAELCDGIDNDCNDFIDEGQLPDADPSIMIQDGAVQLAYTVIPDGPLVVMLTRQTQMPGFFETTGLSVDDLLSGAKPRQPIAADQLCPSSAGNVPCQLSDLAIAASSRALVGAAIQRSGCAPGQLRVGVGSPLDLQLQMGEGSAGFGVDLNGACSLSSDCPGASSPAVGVLPADGAQQAEALVAWLAPTATATATCRETRSFRLAMLGVPIDGSGEAVSLRSPERAPAELIGAIVTGPPTLVASAAPNEDSGYFIAAPSQDHVAVMYVPRLSGDTRIEHHFSAARIPARAASDVALAIDDRSATGLALAFREQSDDERGVLRFVALDVDRSELPHVVRSEAELSVEIEGTIVAGPSIAYAPRGFAAEDSGRSRGGWLVVWAERSESRAVGSDRLMALRIAESELHLLDDGPIELTPPGSIAAPFAYLKHEGDDRESLRYGFTSERALHLRRASCEIDN